MTTAHDPGLVEFTRYKDETGNRYEATTPAGVFMVRQEATTHAYPRGASNPRWFVYQGTGEVGVRQPGGHQRLAEAQQSVRRQVARYLANRVTLEPSSPLTVMEIPETPDEETPGLAH